MGALDKKAKVKKDMFGRNRARSRSASSASGSRSRGREDEAAAAAMMGCYGMPGMWPGMFPGGMPGGMYPSGMPGGMMGPGGMPPSREMQEWEAKYGAMAAAYGLGMFPGYGGMDGKGGWGDTPPWVRPRDGKGGSGGKGDKDRPKGGKKGSRRSRSPPRKRGSGSRDRSGDRSGGEGKNNDTVRLPRNIVGRVIGKQGATINSIREKSGARIDVEDVDNDESNFRIKGTPEEVEKAKAMILDTVEKTKAERVGIGGITSTDKPAEGEVTDFLEFPVHFTGGLIGTRGAKIQEVRQQSGARVQIDKGEDRCKVVMIGTEEQIEQAKKMMAKLAEEEEGRHVDKAADAGAGSGGGDGGEDGDAALPEGHISDTIEFPPAITGGIIGSKGAKIGEVRQQSGAKVQVEKLDDCCKVVISGTKEQVEKARDLVNQLAREGQRMQAERGHRPAGGIEDIVDVPHSMVGRVIGRGGETIQRLQRETGAKIDVNANSGHDPVPVRVCGSRESISRVRYLINDILSRGDKGGGRGPSRQLDNGSWGPGPDAGRAWDAPQGYGAGAWPYPPPPGYPAMWGPSSFHGGHLPGDPPPGVVRRNPDRSSLPRLEAAGIDIDDI